MNAAGGIPVEIRPGGAPPLVLASGWGAGAWCWDPLLEELAGRHETRTFDPRGLGRSQAMLVDADSWSLEEALDDLEAVVAACGEPPVLVGASISGTLALAVAARSRARVRAVVAIGASPCHLRDEDFPIGMDPAQAEAIAGLFRAGFVPAVRGALPSALFSEEERRLHPGLVGRAVDEAVRVESPETFVGLLGRFREVDVRPLLPGIEVPVLLLHGESDASASPDAGRYLAGHLPASRLELIPAAGHLPHLTSPRIVAAAIRAFIA